MDGGQHDQQPSNQAMPEIPPSFAILRRLTLQFKWYPNINLARSFFAPLLSIIRSSPFIWGHQPTYSGIHAFALPLTFCCQQPLSQRYFSNLTMTAPNLPIHSFADVHFPHIHPFAFDISLDKNQHIWLVEKNICIKQMNISFHIF